MSTMPKLQRTRNYSQFVMTKENREVNFVDMRSQHKKLRVSMQKYGFLPAHPLHVRQVGGRLVVLDGQHRLTFAKELGIDVYYVVDDAAVDIAEINQAQAGWRTIDYARKWANIGRADFVKMIEFSERYGIAVATSFAINADTIYAGNISDKLYSGEYKITNGARGVRIGEMFLAIWTNAKSLKDNLLVNALYACTFVESFEDQRLIEAAQKRPHLFSKQPTRDAYLQLIEEVYNFGRKVRVAVKFEADEIMRKRGEVAKPSRRK